MVATTKTLLLPLCVVWFFSLIIAINGFLTTDIGSKRYVIETDKTVNWYLANHACTLLGMSLTSIESEEEFKNLKKYLNDQDKSLEDFWLSGSNLADSANTDYTWLSSGNKLDFAKWKSGSPGTATAGQCIHTASKFEWVVAACATATKQYICSRPLVPNCGITGRCKIDRSFFF